MKTKGGTDELKLFAEILNGPNRRRPPAASLNLEMAMGAMGASLLNPGAHPGEFASITEEDI